MKKFTIKRSHWARGKRELETFLYNPGDESKCCLGFYLESCGVPQEDLEGVGAPFELLGYNIRIPSEAQWLLGQGLPSSKGAAELIRYNDDPPFDDQEREERIAEIFRRHNIEVTFVD